MAKKKTETVPAKGGTKKGTAVKKAVVAKATTAPKKDKVVRGGSKKPQAVTLVTFSMKATIPVQQFGNIQPEITVTAPSIEQARAFVQPIMEEIYQQYAEATPDGRTPKFFKKPEVKVTERIIDQKPTGVAVKPEATTPSTPQQTAPSTVRPQPTAPAKEEDVPFEGTEHPDKPKSAGFLKGEGMVNGAMSMDALNAVEEKIKASVKLLPNEKDQLLTLVLKKRKEF